VIAAGGAPVMRLAKTVVIAVQDAVIAAVLQVHDEAKTAAATEARSGAPVTGVPVRVAMQTGPAAVLTGDRIPAGKPGTRDVVTIAVPVAAVQGAATTAVPVAAVQGAAMTAVLAAGVREAATEVVTVTAPVRARVTAAVTEIAAVTALGMAAVIAIAAGIALAMVAVMAIAAAIVPAIAEGITIAAVTTATAAVTTAAIATGRDIRAAAIPAALPMAIPAVSIDPARIIIRGGAMADGIIPTVTDRAAATAIGARITIYSTTIRDTIPSAGSM
jgi:hypothetical protein